MTLSFILENSKIYTNTISSFKLKKNDIHAWLFDLNTELSIKYLSEEEQKRAKKFKNQTLQSYFIRSRTYLRAVLSQYLSIDPMHIKYVYNNDKKPFIAPLTTPPIQFNLSHSDNYLLIGVCKTSLIGVDIETIRPIQNIDQLATRFFTSKEAEKLKKISSLHKKKQAFFRCWCRKESTIKAVGSTLGKLLNKFEVSFLENETPKIITNSKTNNLNNLYLTCPIINNNISISITTTLPNANLQTTSLLT